MALAFLIKQFYHNVTIEYDGRNLWAGGVTEKSILPMEKLFKNGTKP